MKIRLIFSVLCQFLWLIRLKSYLFPYPEGGIDIRTKFQRSRIPPSQAENRYYTIVISRRIVDQSSDFVEGRNPSKARDKSDTLALALVP